MDQKWSIKHILMTFWERQSKDYIKELSISGENIFLRGRETPMCEKYIDQLPLAWPQLGTQPTTQACALTRIQMGDLSVHRLAPSPLSHTSHGRRKHVHRIIGKIKSRENRSYLYKMLEKAEFRLNPMYWK